MKTYHLTAEKRADLIAAIERELARWPAWGYGTVVYKPQQIRQGRICYWTVKIERATSCD